MRDVAVVGFAQSASVRRETSGNEVEMLMPILQEVVRESGLARQDIQFTMSGSCDYLAGQPFAFVSALDAVGAWPPIVESHVEMDGAWALYEAWVKLQLGDVDTALVYCYGKSAPGPLHEVLSRQLDPYHVAPLWPDAISLAALQARMLLDAGKATEADFAEVVSRSRRNAINNPNAQLAWDFTTAELLDEPMMIDPLRKSDCPPITDGACAVILASGDRARELRQRPAWIRGIDHRIEPMALGLRDLTVSVSTRAAAAKAGLSTAPVDVAELHAPFAPQELILREALGLGGHDNVNPSGGPLAANPVMVAGLTRIGEVAQRIMDGTATRGVAHATSGPCLQQNLVTVLEGEG